MIKMTGGLLWLVICIGVVAITGFGEPSNPFENQTVVQPSDGNRESQPNFGSGLAGSIFQSKRANENSIGPVGSNGDGREGKARESKNTASNGSGVAIGTGAALLGVGIPMSLVPEIITMVAGIELIVKGSLELAQGIASARAADGNRYLEDTLRKAGDPSQNALPSNSSEAAATARAKEALLTPEIKNALEKTGTDPEQFANQMLSNNGAGATGENVARALGVPIESLNEARGQGSDALVTSELNKIKSMGLGTESFASGLEGESADKFTDKSNGLASGKESESGGTEGQTEAGHAAALVGGSATGPHVAGGAQAKPIEKGESKDYLAGLFPPGILEPGAVPAKQDLIGIGILSPPKGRTIFQVARNEYRSFSKWRRGTLVTSVASRD